MRRLLTTFALGTALVASVTAQNRSAVLTYTHFGSESVRGFRMGDEFFVPLETIEKIGWQASSSGDSAKVVAEGSTSTVPIRYLNDRPCIAIRKIIQELGGYSTWIPGYDSLEVTSLLDEISDQHGVVSVKAPLGVKPTISVVTNPNGVMIDIEGAKLSPQTRLELEPEAKAVQFRPNSVRIFMKTAFMPRLPKSQLDPAQQVVLDVNPAPVNTEVPRQANREKDGPIKSIEQNGQISTVMDALPIFVDLENSSTTLISVKIRRELLAFSPDFRKPSPNVLEVSLPGLVTSLPDGFNLGSNLVRSTEIRYENGGSILKLELTRAMGAEVWTTSAGIQIQLTPPVLSGSLAGKLIVIDAGHGGHDGGCHAGGVYEKDLTLAIATEVSSQLAAAGATVLMTRKGDTYPTLDERCQLANKSKADFFISIHINAPGKGKASPSGTQTYHRMNKPMSLLLAECVHRELMKATGMPNQGYKSDRVLYKGGLKVLRDTTMPAILIECGFITHPNDRSKMQQKSYRQSVGSSIVKGLKVYLGS